MSGPVLTTERLELWQPQLGDLPDLFELTRSDEARRFLGSFVPSEMDSFARLYRNAGSWALHGYGIFMVRLSGQPQIVGTCGVFRSHRGFGAALGLDDVPEAGWIIHPGHWGQGIAREAMEAALAWFDETGKPLGCRVLFRTNPDEFADRSCKALLQRAKFNPARDAQGKPVKSFYINTIRWMAGAY